MNVTDSIVVDEGGQNPLLNLLNQCVFEDNMFKKFNAVDTLISALNPDIQQKVGGKVMKAYLHTNVLSNERFVRQVQLYSRITENTETAIEYYGEDHITHPEFHFDQNFIKTLNAINKKVNDFVGSLIRELNKGVEFEL